MSRQRDRDLIDERLGQAIKAPRADIFDRAEGTLEADPQPARQSYYLTDKLINRVKKYAKRQGYPASTIVKMALEDYLEKHGG